MKLNILSLALPLTLAPLAMAQDDPFAELESEMKAFSPQAQQAEKQEFEQWKNNYLAEYQQFRVEHYKKLDDIRDKLINTWGESEISDQSKYVQYDENNKTKAVVDFEKNEIRVSVIHQQDEKVNQDKIENAIVALTDQFNTNQSKKNNAIEQLVGKPIDKKTINKLVKTAERTDKERALNIPVDEIYLREAKIINQQALEQKAQVEKVTDIISATQTDEEIEQEQPKTEAELQQQQREIEKEKQQRLAYLREKLAKLKAENQRKQAEQQKILPTNKNPANDTVMDPVSIAANQPTKKITTYTIQLPDQPEIKLAKPYIKEIVQQAKRWQLDPSLMLAIMHTESYFNPKAQSHIPAYGLMQIVPRSASIDVNHFLYKQKSPMTETELFNPEKNIETGVAYMHILNSRYLKAITNETSRQYCMVAAYNTGAGNVAKAFNGKNDRNIKRAAVIINKLTPEEVYERLLAHLPYNETKNYVVKVIKRENIYTVVNRL